MTDFHSCQIISHVIFFHLKCQNIMRQSSGKFFLLFFGGIVRKVFYIFFQPQFLNYPLQLILQRVVVCVSIWVEIMIRIPHDNDSFQASKSEQLVKIRKQCHFGFHQGENPGTNFPARKHIFEQRKVFHLKCKSDQSRKSPRGPSLDEHSYLLEVFYLKIEKSLNFPNFEIKMILKFVNNFHLKFYEILKVFHENYSETWKGQKRMNSQ